MSSTIKYANKVEIPASSISNHYKQWKDKNNLLGTGYSTCYSRSSPLAGKNGTYNTPAPVILTNFGFTVPATANIEKVVIHYNQKKEQLSSPIGQTAYPAINAPKITLLNSGGLYATGTAVPTNYTTYTKEFSGTAEFTNVTPAMINSNLFGVKFEYPKNANTNPGVVWLGNVYIEVVFEDKNIVLSIDNPNPNIVYNEEFTLTFNCNYTGNEQFILKMPIDLDDVTYIHKQSGNGDIITENGQIYWNVGFTGTATRQVVLRLKSTSIGNKNISISYNNITATRTITVNPKSLTITNGIKNVKRIVQNQHVNYQVILETNNTNRTYENIKITYPEDTIINNMEELVTKYNATTALLEGTLYLDLNVYYKGQENINLDVTFTHTGYFTQETYYNYGLKYISDNYIVYEDRLGDLAFEYIQIPDTITERMNNNVTYTFSCFTRWTSGRDDVTIQDHEDNLRIGVFNANSSFMVEYDDFLDHVVWSTDLPTTNFKQVKVDFKYKDYNPLCFVVSHSHVSETNYHYVGLDYSEPILVEKQFFNSTTNNRPILSPVRNIIADGDYSTGILPSAEEFCRMLCYDFELGGLDRLTNGLVSDTSDLLIQGIEIQLDYTSSELVKLETSLYIPGIRSATRNISVKGSGTITLGRKYDTWGVKLGDLQKNISMLGILIRVLNNESNKAYVELKNLKINIYYIPRPYVGEYGFIVDGESSKDYGIYLENVELPFGTKYDKEEYHINGTDENTVTRTNIDTKELKLEIGIDDCDEEDIIYLLDKAETLLTNKRELQTNEPILKDIIFDIMPNWRYKFVRVKEFDGEFTKGSYTAKITLYVPSGTREAISKTITGSTGTTGSYVPVKPIIYSKVTTDGRFTLKETNNNFILSIKNNNITKGDTIVIDNTDRTVKLIKNGTNVQTRLYDGIDLETTWFVIDGEYNFTSTTGNVYQVEYYEKR